MKRPGEHDPQTGAEVIGVGGQEAGLEPAPERLLATATAAGWSPVVTSTTVRPVTPRGQASGFDGSAGGAVRSRCVEVGSVRAACPSPSTTWGAAGAVRAVLLPLSPESLVISEMANPNSPAPTTTSATISGTSGSETIELPWSMATRPPQLRHTSWRGSTGCAQVGQGTCPGGRASVSSVRPRPPFRLVAAGERLLLERVALVAHRRSTASSSARTS